MNEITFSGNVSKIYEARVTSSGDTIFAFDLAVDNGYFDKGRNRWMSRTRFQPVVTYRELATNALTTLTKGMAVTVTGKLLDDSYTPAGSDSPVRRDKLEALDVAVSLRFATAAVTKASKAPREEGLEHNREQLAATA
ncbi:MAG: single-stranded DNA-binding protein [Pseudonocardiaceae bacterium]